MTAPERRILENKTLLRPDEVAAILGVSKRTVYRLIESGALDAVTVGVRRGLRVKASSLKEYTS